MTRFLALSLVFNALLWSGVAAIFARPHSSQSAPFLVTLYSPSPVSAPPRKLAMRKTTAPRRRATHLPENFKNRDSKAIKPAENFKGQPTTATPKISTPKMNSLSLSKSPSSASTETISPTKANASFSMAKSPEFLFNKADSAPHFSPSPPQSNEGAASNDETSSTRPIEPTLELPTPEPPTPEPRPTAVPPSTPRATPTLQPDPTPRPVSTSRPIPAPTSRSGGPTRTAQATRKVAVVLPDEVREEEFSSSVRVRVEISRDGYPTPTLRASSGNARVDELVLSALKKWRWQPALEDGEPVASVENFRFEISVR